LGYEEIFLAKMPIVFVAGPEAGVRELTKDQVCNIYTGAITNWKQVGGNDRKIILVTREATEALFQDLKKALPCMNQVTETRFVLKSDSHVVEMLKTMELGNAAIGFGAMGNFPKAVRLEVPGFFPGTRLGLVYKISNRDDPVVRAAIEIANGKQWLQGLAALGFGAP
jgi:phosphate transport system substrate-binding protein